MDIREKYENLTNVDIERQKLLWDERGKGYYGEYLVFCELYKRMQGNCKILMNLNIPTENNKTTEVDLVMIHESGIFVFEVKHYKGTIYGDANGKIWTQYFRTVKNEVLKNPILQNEYHIKAIKKMFPDVPIKSVIVFTNNECDIRVNNNSNVDICKLNYLSNTLNSRLMLDIPRYSIEEIDEMFQKLSNYSSMKEIVPYNGKEEPFNFWLQPIIDELELEKSRLINNQNSLKKERTIYLVLFILILIAYIVFSVLTANSIEYKYNKDLNTAKTNYTNELNLFKQNFKHVDEIDNEYIKNLNELVSVTNVSLKTLTSNSATFTARLSMNNDVYGIKLNEDSKYIVMSNSNVVHEYDVFGEHLKYQAYNNMIGKGIRQYGDLTPTQFYGPLTENIDYIKITNVTLFKLDYSRTVVKENLELELYSK